MIAQTFVEVNTQLLLFKNTNPCWTKKIKKRLKLKLNIFSHFNILNCLIHKSHYCVYNIDAYFPVQEQFLFPYSLCLLIHMRSKRLIFSLFITKIDLDELFDKICPRNCRSQMVKLLKWQGDWHWRKVYW